MSFFQSELSAFCLQSLSDKLSDFSFDDHQVVVVKCCGGYGCCGWDEDDEINSDASTSEDECDVGNEDTFEDCINSDDEDEKLNDIHGDDNNKTEYVELVQNTTGCSGFKTTNQYESYRYRSIQARHLSFYEYTAMMSLEEFDIEEIDKGINNIRTPLKDNVKKQSRYENGWNYLHDNHPMRYSHKEKLRSKQILPVISTRSPRLLHELPEDDNAMKNDAALFYLTLFCPVDPVTGLLIAVWASYSDRGHDTSLKPYKDEKDAILAIIELGKRKDELIKQLPYRCNVCRQFHNTHLISRETLAKLIRKYKN
jgi:hypothetical protein